MRTAERLSEHTRTLPPLAIGDCVRIQNQTGPNPTKWDKTGIVVEVRQYDQYVVRVDGSGRVTLRNRKFLRKYIPVVPRTPLMMAPGTIATQPAAHVAPTPPTVPHSEPSPQTTPPPPPEHPKPLTPDTQTLTPSSPPRPTSIITADPSPEAVSSSPQPARNKDLPRTLRVLQPHNSPGLKEHATTPASDTPPGGPRRSTRTKHCKTNDSK